MQHIVSQHNSYRFRAWPVSSSTRNGRPRPHYFYTQNLERPETPDDVAEEKLFPWELTFAGKEYGGCRTRLLGKLKKCGCWFSNVEHPWKANGLISRLLCGWPKSPTLQHSPVILLPFKIWSIIMQNLMPWEKASLSLTCHLLLEILGSTHIKRLNRVDWEFKNQRLRLLYSFDGKFPKHRLCFACAIFHLGFDICHRESSVFVPVYPGLWLRFRDVQLLVKAHRHNIPTGAFARTPYDVSFQANQGNNYRFKWKHSVSYVFQENRLLLRVDSVKAVYPCIEPRAVLGHTACHHYKEELFEICSCAIDHVCSQDVCAATICFKCRPLRRCHSCATEYLVRLESCVPMSSNEQAKESDTHGQLLRVTRWSDLSICDFPFTRVYRRAASLRIYARKAVFDTRQAETIQSRFESSTGRYVEQQKILPLHG